MYGTPFDSYYEVVALAGDTENVIDTGYVKDDAIKAAKKFKAENPTLPVYVEEYKLSGTIWTSEEKKEV